MRSLCHGKEDPRLQPIGFLLSAQASAASLIRPKPGSSAATASSTGASSLSRSLAEMTSAPAAPDASFKRCCLQSGRYDGAQRAYYFSAQVTMDAGQSPRSRAAVCTPALVSFVPQHRGLQTVAAEVRLPMRSRQYKHRNEAQNNALGGNQSSQGEWAALR
jgi:hypothetical protein